MKKKITKKKNKDNKEKIKKMTKEIEELKKSKSFGIFYLYEFKGGMHLRMYTCGFVKNNLEMFKDGFNYSLSLQNLQNLRKNNN